MTELQVLLQPLILLSGIGLLILSTFARLTAIEARETANCDAAQQSAERQFLRNALALLYLACGLVLLASFSGAMAALAGVNLQWFVGILTCAAVGVAGGAVVYLGSNIRSMP